MKEYYVYIVASLSKKIYTGVTNDLARRVYEHKHKVVSGFTSQYHIGRLVYYETHRSILDAITREKRLRLGAERRSWP
jgi:putative endonuclease